MDAQTKGKIIRFYQVMEKMQTVKNFRIGMIITSPENETLSDIASLAPNSNRVTSVALDQDSNGANIIVNELAAGLEDGRIILLQISGYLDPKIYNQLYLLANSGRMEYVFLDQERVFIYSKLGAQIILLSSQENLDKLNYTNILNLVSLVKRL